MHSRLQVIEACVKLCALGFVHCLAGLVMNFSGFRLERACFPCCYPPRPTSNKAAVQSTEKSALPLPQLPAAVTKKLPRYRAVPTVRMGRLAVDARFKGHGLGGALLADALLRCKRSAIAAYALIVDAKDDSASAFYRHHGFIALPEAALTLFLPLASVAKLD
jgi:GNAT superfamily N-acetyltransferase